MRKVTTAAGAGRGPCAVPQVSEKLNSLMDEPKSISVFDLSASEELQLVEDSWDDLAATPGDVPVHDWRKHKLARRRANLQRNPGSALSWPDVKLRVRERGAGLNLLLRQKPNLVSLRRTLGRTTEGRAGRGISQCSRSAIEVDESAIVVYRIFHAARDPVKWRARLE